MLGTTTNPTSLRHKTDKAWRGVKRSYRMVATVILVTFVLSPLVMAACNAIGWQPLTAIWTVLVTFAILIWGLRPTNLGWVSVLGGTYALLMDRDGSQGVAAGPKWLWNVVISIAFAHFMMGLVATTWDFTHVSGGFMAAWFIGLGFVLWNLKFPTKAWWYQRLTLAALLVCTAGIIWQSFNINVKGDVLYQEAFDPHTGEPLKMGYVTASGDWVADPLGRTPAECRMRDSKGITFPHFFANGEVYPYETDGTCRSTITGERLVPISKEYVPDASRTTLPGLIDPFFRTPEEREAAEKAAELKEAEEQFEKLLEQKRAAAEAEARRPVVRQVVQVVPQVVRTAGCTGSYRNTLNCETIVFPPGMSTDWIVDRIAGEDRARCVQFYPEGLQATPDSTGVFELKNTSRFERTFKVYEVFEGESGPGNNRCG